MEDRKMEDLKMQDQLLESRAVGILQPLTTAKRRQFCIKCM